LSIVSSLGQNILQDGLVSEWLEGISITFVELVLELDPMETEGMQEALKGVHAHEYTETNTPEGWEGEETN